MIRKGQQKDIDCVVVNRAGTLGMDAWRLLPLCALCVGPAASIRPLAVPGLPPAALGLGADAAPQQPSLIILSLSFARGGARGGTLPASRCRSCLARVIDYPLAARCKRFTAKYPKTQE